MVDFVAVEEGVKKVILRDKPEWSAGDVNDVVDWVTSLLDEELSDVVNQTFQKLIDHASNEGVVDNFDVAAEVTSQLNDHETGFEMLTKTVLERHPVRLTEHSLKVFDREETVLIFSCTVFIHCGDGVSELSEVEFGFEVDP